MNLYMSNVYLLLYNKFEGSKRMELLECKMTLAANTYQDKAIKLGSKVDLYIYMVTFHFISGAVAGLAADERLAAHVSRRDLSAIDIVCNQTPIVWDTKAMTAVGMLKQTKTFMFPKPVKIGNIENLYIGAIDGIGGTFGCVILASKNDIKY